MSRNILVGTLILTGILSCKTVHSMNRGFPRPQNIPRDTATLPAQINSPGIWISGAIGVGNYWFLKTGLNAATKDNVEFQFQVLGATTNNGLGLDLFEPPQSTASFYAPGILIGRRFLHPGYFFSFETGLSYLRGVNTIVTVTGNDCGWFGGAGECTTSKDEAINTIGIPIQFNVYASSKYIGVGLEFYANLNKVGSLAGVALAVPLGLIHR